uniref:Thioredoxin domain-containing protein n=1 Tax=Bartheletia paradoxa TaxID=669517 RepID=A0A2D0XHX1_9BASI|nr:hypothetical protein SPAR03474 [Bartheletia paradoxa]
MSILRTALRSSACHLARQASVTAGAASPLRSFARAYSASRPAFNQTPTSENRTPTPKPSSTEAPDEEKKRNAASIGPFGLKAGALFLITGGGLYFYFEEEKKKVAERKRMETATIKAGRPLVGGPFSLVAQNGKPFTHEDLFGKFSLIYFGFTNCPDICPEELDKMGCVVDEVAKKYGEVITPVFISCDPARDTVEQVAQYVTDFHPSLIGLTGPYASIKSACKVFRVYFSTPPDASPDQDYLVDHSIFFYLMDPNGKFVEAFGRATSEQDIRERTNREVGEWVMNGGKFRMGAGKLRE